MPDHYESYCTIRPTDRKPVGTPTHVKVVSTGWGHQINRWRDEAGQLWDIGPGYREWVGKAEEE